MEKVFIKPTAKEIMLKGNGKDGPSDLFSYDYSDSGHRGLGHLYVVGNIQPGEAASSDDLDVGYVINLVASLAKREYYAKADLEPKEAFGAALKKINGVIEEFFKHKDTKINIGLFTIASGQLHIAKLGKFKILLARDGANIDILNNVDLFKKESTQEKQFSNIISGTVSDGDRILAFYPSRVMTAREKQLKASLLGLDQAEFTKKLEAIKDDKQDFACAAVHIELHKATEAATAQNIQPKELHVAPEEVEAEEPITAPMHPAVQLAAAEESVDEVEEITAQEEPVVIHEAPKAKAHKIIPDIQEIPKIIPAEFSLGRKHNPLAKYTAQLKNMRVTPKNRAFVLGGAATLVLVSVFVLKSFVFVSASARALSSAAAEADSSIKAAQTKVSQNDLIGAHSLLLSSLASLNESVRVNGTSDKVDSAKQDILEALDGLEQATDATLTAVATLSAEDGTGRLLAASGNDIYAYVDRNETGAIVKISGGSVSGGVEVKDVSPSALFASNDYVSAVDLATKKVSSLSLSKNTIGSATFPGDAPVAVDVYQNNLYGITATSIIKITDAASGHSDVAQWLKASTLASDPRLIAVDGNIYVLSDSGVLTVYYKGEKKNEFNTPILADANSMMLSSTDGSSLYVINKTLGRIYVLNKTSGNLERTLKLNSNAAISGAAVAEDGTLYVLIDNKVWKVN